MKKNVIIFIGFILLSSVITTSVYADDYTSSDPNKNSYFNRTNCQRYIEKWAYDPPNPKYIYYSGMGGDCTNFVSQVLGDTFAYQNVYSGGLKQWFDNPDYNKWNYQLANTTNYDNPNVWRSYSWTDAHWFRKHFGHVHELSQTVGKNRAYSYKVYRVGYAADNFNSILYNVVKPGDVVQYGDSATGNTIHSQVVYRKTWNPYVANGIYDVMIAEHSGIYGNQRDRSLYEDLQRRKAKDVNTYFFVYRIKKD